MAALNIAEKRERFMMRRVGHSLAPVLKAGRRRFIGKSRFANSFTVTGHSHRPD